MLCEFHYCKAFRLLHRQQPTMCKYSYLHSSTRLSKVGGGGGGVGVGVTIANCVTIAHERTVR